MPDSLLVMLTGVREDVAAMRAEVSAARRETATLAAEATAARRDLEQHRADDRRELDQLGGGLAELGGDVKTLRHRERLIAGGLALLAVLVVGIGVPVLAGMIGG